MLNDEEELLSVLSVDVLDELDSVLEVLSTDELAELEELEELDVLSLVVSEELVSTLEELSFVEFDSVFESHAVKNIDKEIVNNRIFLFIDNSRLLNYNYIHLILSRKQNYFKSFYKN